MEQIISTVMFDGQFWIILIEEISESGEVSLAKYIFGSEPTFNDILKFYDECISLSCFSSFRLSV